MIIQNEHSQPQKEQSSRRFQRILINATTFDKDRIGSLLPFIMFVFLLALIYISNTYLAQRTIKTIAHNSKQINELKWEYMTLKSTLMYISKQTEIENRVVALGIKTATSPPEKILISNGVD